MRRHVRDACRLRDAFLHRRAAPTLRAARDTLFKTATETVGGPPEKLARLAREDSEKYARIVREANIKVGG